MILLLSLMAAPAWATKASTRTCIADLQAKLTADLAPGMSIKVEHDEHSVHVWIDAPIDGPDGAASERFVVASLEAEITGDHKERLDITWLNDDQGETRRSPALLTYALAHAGQIDQINVELPADDLRFVVEQLEADRRPSEAIVQTATFRTIAAHGFGALRDFKFEMDTSMIDPPLNLVITLARD